MALNIKDELKKLIDEIPDEELRVARRFLQFLRQQSRGPLRAALDGAPWDDEPLTPEDVGALDEAVADVEAGRIIPHEDVRRKLLAHD